MASTYFWLLCASLCLTVQGKQHALTVPEIVGVSINKKNTKDFGDWKMDIEWRDNFFSGNTYDVEIFYTEQMQRVHQETIEDPMGTHKWSWTSPLPLQCTSHSVRLRSRHLSHTSDWTPLYTLRGKDTEERSTAEVYPKDHVARVGEDTIFCCILKPESVANFSSSIFTVQISNRTYASQPVHHDTFSPAGGFDMHCDDSGSTYFTGYAPDDHSLTCETRDLESVECHWSRGEIGLAAVLQVQYTLNGRNCSFEKCVQDETVDKGVMNWTLVARNILGVKTISDVADPKHRVRLKAPGHARADPVHARNATLEWQWGGASKFSSFLMICQAEVNGHTVQETFEGTGLKSLILADLQPFTEYTARVRCGSHEHFYKWGDWSDSITFTTQEDKNFYIGPFVYNNNNNNIPEAVDVWMQVLDGHTYIVWKNLSRSQSHGIITGYELLSGSSTDMNKMHDCCFQLSPRSADGDHVVSVSAKNSVGVSPPSSITIPNLWADAGIIKGHIKGQNGSFSMSWDPSPVSSCGYVVDWFPTYSAEQCAVKWMKLPPGVSHATVNSDFENGVKYTLSVYACTSDAPQLLQRREGYVKELAPSGIVRNLKAEQHGVNVELTWNEVSEMEKKGFIVGYVVSQKLNDDTNSSFTEVSRMKASSRKCKLSHLHPGSYTFTVKALTSAGEGPEADFTFYVDEQSYTFIISIYVALGTVACVTTIIVLCFSKREWLKSKLYPDTPKPVLSGQWHTQCHVMDKLLLAESEVLMMKNPESCLLIVPQLQKAQEELDLKSKDPPWPRYCHNVCDQKTQTVSPLTVDFSYLELQSPGIDNLTYNIPLSLPNDANVVLGYIPQIQKVNNQLQPYDVRPAHAGSVGYQAQSRVPLQTYEIPTDTSLPLHCTSVSSSEYLVYSACSKSTALEEEPKPTLEVRVSGAMLTTAQHGGAQPDPKGEDQRSHGQYYTRRGAQTDPEGEDHRSQGQYCTKGGAQTDPEGEDHRSQGQYCTTRESPNRP
ncbi:hypothetical protein NFI96_032027 [Prochilodus magdalenae]|nr:hypothetical protein NFI96_032027 [Prochilodus magdalenae]